MTLNVERHVSGTKLTLTIQGVLDYATIGILNERIGKVEGITRFLLDFTGMEFTDSTGIGAVLDIIYFANEHNVKVEFCGLSKDVKDVFETMGVFQIVQALQGRE